MVSFGSGDGRARGYLSFSACGLNRSEKLYERSAQANGASGAWTFEARSIVEGAVEERGEEVFGLAQRLPLYRTQALYSFN